MFTDLQPGMVFHENHNQNTSIEIVSVNGHDVTYKSLYFGKEKTNTLPKNSVLDALNFGRWELRMTERAVNIQKLKDLSQGKPVCFHKNVRRDLFFSAKAYLTCKDCGHPLN